MSSVDVTRENRRIIQTVRGRRRRAPHFDVVFSARPNLFQQPGGDSEVVIHVKRALTEAGYKIDFHPIPGPGADCDLVHIFNCDIRIALETALLRKPYVVTPMYEDVDRYQVRSMRLVSYFKEFLSSGDRLDFEKRLTALNGPAPQPNTPDLSFVFGNASGVCVTGAYEADRIREGFPEVNGLQVVRVGFSRPAGAEAASPDLFANEFGVRDFVLCVGRLESRKNQLMLLYSLQDEDIPLVFIGSQSVQPEYESMCRAFPRRGKTVFTGRLPIPLLYSAYRAARVHALPSWYELPGLVTLEAAWFGCNVVATDWGTLREYLGDTPFYCQPNDPGSVRQAVLDALAAPREGRGRAMLEQCTWEEEAGKLADLYRRIAAARDGREEQNRLRLAEERARQEMTYHQTRGRAAQDFQADPLQGVRMLDRLVLDRPADPLNYLLRGEALLKLGMLPDAERDLTQAISLRMAGQETAYLYLALALIQQRKYDAARKLLAEVQEIYPFMNRGAREIVSDYMRRCQT